MAAPIAGFIAALVLSAAVIVWIAYCMFCRERYRSEDFHYDVSDLRQKNYEIAQKEETKEKKSNLSAGIFILPSRHRHKDESYEKGPDYPESPVTSFQPEPLVEIFSDNIDADIHYKDGIYEIDSNAQYQSDV